ncbi:class I SAM-dependent methyltransferase [Streptomyces himalayensis]|uniref:Class I SAM-dependent methyltransferase n=1 Tax=Streptomyces himalayensis subsp. himalayensis TaxID=2756131 RepID=A0A7W0DK60_9ACTN|nr:class I SAM-dependent methyltransferase [Streptomyces himalayensis]MBA2946597.1 class I SAM-dependent methyltransferase [Streptomyces himalayensis subsp. himalayensis]
MLDYDKEAAVYDRTRGGVPRARAAAEAVLGLVPSTSRTLLDVACGTGLVTGRLTRPGMRTLGVDISPGMLSVAARRLDGAVVLGDSRRLPFADSSFDAVTAIWLLHLLPDAAPVVAEAARVLRPGGVFVTTVDKNAAHDVGSDIDVLVAPHRSARAADESARITEYAAAHGLRPWGEACFRGHGQGRTPRRLADEILRGRVYATGGQALADRVAALPDPDMPRAEPVYRLRAFRYQA